MRAAREEWLAKSARLQMTVVEQEQALEEVRAENAQLTQSLSVQEERLAETLRGGRPAPRRTRSRGSGRSTTALDHRRAGQSTRRGHRTRSIPSASKRNVWQKRSRRPASSQPHSIARKRPKHNCARPPPRWTKRSPTRSPRDLNAQASQLPAALDRAEAAELQLQSATAELDKALAESARLTQGPSTPRPASSPPPSIARKQRSYNCSRPPPSWTEHSASAHNSPRTSAPKRNASRKHSPRPASLRLPSPTPRMRSRSGRPSWSSETNS